MVRQGPAGSFADNRQCSTRAAPTNPGVNSSPRRVCLAEEAYSFGSDEGSSGMRYTRLVRQASFKGGGVWSLAAPYS